MEADDHGPQLYVFKCLTWVSARVDQTWQLLADETAAHRATFAQGYIGIVSKKSQPGKSVPLMRAIALFAFAFSAIVAVPRCEAQAADSILVTIPSTGQAAVNRVVGAFLSAGLRVTEASAFLVTADLGRDRSAGLVTNQLWARAAVVQRGDSSVVLLWAESRDASVVGGNYPYGVTRITSESKKDPAKVWGLLTRAKDELLGR